MRKEMELMRILRTPPMGKLVVEIQKHRFASLADLEGDEKAIRIINAAIGELVAFAGGYEELVKAGVAPELAPVAGAPEAGDTMNEEQAAFLAQMEAERDALRADPAAEIAGATPEPLTPPSTPSTSSPPPAVADAPAPESAKMSIVEQIDSILQGFVDEVPEFANRSIRIIQSPAGGVNIKVDGKLYGRPQEVEEAAVQAVIKKALKAWEDN